MKGIYLLAVLAVMGSSASAALRPEQSFECESAGSEVDRFDFDLYATGHPMGGIGMYTGMFEASVHFPPCPTLRGSIEIGSVDKKVYTYNGISSCIDKAEFSLAIDYSKSSSDGKFPSQLKYRTYNPFGPDEWKSEEMLCKVGNDEAEGKKEKH